MSTKHHTFHLAAWVAVLIGSLGWVAQAQTSSLHVNVEREQARFVFKGEARQIRVEIYNPGGELIFDSGEVSDPTIVWNLLDQQGQAVAD